jgi:YidC/Oxa1 family membrane protein insertase
LLTGCTQTLKSKDNQIVKYDSSIICKNCDSSCNVLQKEYDELDKKTGKTTTEIKRLEDLTSEIATCKSDCTKKCNLAKENETEQSLTSNILCRPTNTDVIEIYKLNGVDVQKLPACKDFKPFSNYEGVWVTGFVKPLTWLIIQTGLFLKNYGFALVLISLFLRAIMIPITKKSTMQSENIKKAQPEIDKINKKYEGKTDEASNSKKTQETLSIYKKYDINPLASCIFALIQIPLLFAFIEAINRTPAIFEGKFLGLRLGLTPWAAIKSGEWWYALIIVVLVVVTYFSLNLNSKNTSKEKTDQEKQMGIMNKFMIVFIGFASFTLSTAICLYWISSSAFTAVQNILVKRVGKK